MSRFLSLLPLSVALWIASGALAQTPQSSKAPDKHAPAAAPAEAGKPASALDKKVLEAWARHLLVMDSRITVTVSDPKPAPIPGFVEETLHASLGERSQDFLFYISNDGSKIVQGTVWDAAQNPFKKDLERLNTAFQPSMGTPGATVVLVEFSDFQCPYCKQEAEMLRQNLLKEYPTQVRLYYKEFPLVELHPWAKAAAIDGRCIFQQSATTFWDYHDWIYGHQAEVTPENLREKVLDWAKTAKGIEMPQLTSCIDSKGGEQAVDKNMAEGREMDVNQTPMLFVNGRRVPGVVDWPTLKNIIDYEIDYQKTAKNAGEDCGCNLTLQLPGAPAVQTTLPLQKKDK